MLGSWGNNSVQVARGGFVLRMGGWVGLGLVGLKARHAVCYGVSRIIMILDF